MSNWIPFEKATIEESVWYAVTYKGYSVKVDVYRGSQLHGADNVLAVAALELPVPYIPPPPKPRETIQFLKGRYIEVREGDPDPDAVKKVIEEMRRALQRGNLPHLLGKWIKDLEAKS